MTSKNQDHSSVASITEVAKVEKIVDYSFERSEKLNVLAIHPTRPLIAYLINIQRTPNKAKGLPSGNDSLQSPSSSMVNGQNNILSSSDKNKTVSIRIIDYQTRQRCLAKGIYYTRPVECAFTINSIICSQSDVIKMAVVDQVANIYLYDLSYFVSDLIATRIAVIRSPTHEPYSLINLVWCPFVPCDDFDDGDGGLRLALSTDSKIEIFAIDRLQGKTGELHRGDLKDAYKCIQDVNKFPYSSLSISPDCSTISAAVIDNRVTFFSIDNNDLPQRCLHSWHANMVDSSISKLFFLDDYPKLLEDNKMKFWGTAFIGTSSGQMLLIDLRTWTVYQKMHLNPDGLRQNSFDYCLDLTSRNMIAISGTQCYVVQIEHNRVHLSPKLPNSTEVATKSPQRESSSFLESCKNDMANGNIFDYLLSKSAAAAPRSVQKQPTPKKSITTNSSGIDDDAQNGLPKIVKTTKLSLHTPIYSFVVKFRSNEEIELFTISAYSLERYTISLSALETKSKPPEPQQSVITPKIIKHEVAASSATAPKASNLSQAETVSVGVNQMDKMVEALFTKLNTSFSQGLDEFMSEIKCEVNDLKSKLNVLCRDVNKLQQQLQDIRHR